MTTEQLVQLALKETGLTNDGDYTYIESPVDAYQAGFKKALELVLSNELVHWTTAYNKTPEQAVQRLMEQLVSELTAS